MTQATKQRSARDLWLRMLEIVNTHDFDALGEVLADDVVIDWPQTNERTRGVRNIAEVFRNFPGGMLDTPATGMRFMGGDAGKYLLTPMFTVVKAEGAGDSSTSVVLRHYADGGDWYVITMAQASNGKVVKATQYFAPVGPAPEWRSHWVEPID